VLFAFDLPDTSKAVQYCLNGLAVGGAFLVGYLLTWLLAKLLDNWMTAGKSPPAVHKTVRILGGLLAAVVAAIFLFGPGGSGLGFGGAQGEGKGQGTGEQQGGGDPTKQTQPISTDAKPTEQQKTEAVPPDQRLRVTVLGGENVTEQRFYQLEGESIALDYAALKAAVTKQQQAGGKPVAIEVRYATGAGPDTPGTTQLRRQATNDGLTIILPGGPK
jgi:hypothetical protein